MSSKTKTILFIPVVIGVTIGLVLSGNLLLARPDQGASDAMPLGRSAAAIVDGKYPASYFPNTELLGADEMRITALG
ncbi:MAG: hypothetical protein IFK93_16775, partial [Acidobacteria bacterium]|nr:hypothetical protein [Candidatus Sulfomarinibacter kjeldsenii]